MGKPDRRQLSFDFGQGPPPGETDLRHELFFALLPDPAAAARCAALALRLKSDHRLAAKPRPERLLHVTLANIVPQAMGLSQAIDAQTLGHRLNEAAQRLRTHPFRLSFDRIMTFQQPKRPIVLCAGDGRGAVQLLHQQLAAAGRAGGLSVPFKADMEPHVTLLYDRRAVPPATLEEPIEWTVRDIVLIRSHIGFGRHDHLGRWPLCG